MSSSNRTERTGIRRAAAAGIRDALSRALWTVLSAFTVLVGVQLLQIAALTPADPVATAGFGLVGAVVVGASGYLLSLLHW